MILDGLDDTDWASLGHAYGSAADVPAQLRALLSDDANVREEARYELGGNIWHQGTVYQATVYAVPFLFRIAAAQGAPDRASLVVLIGAIAEAYDTRATERARVRAAVLDHVDVIRTLLSDEEPLVRAGASYILGSLDSIAEDAAASLLAALDGERHELVRCAILLSLSRLGGDMARLEEHFRAADTEAERLAAAIALAHASRGSTPADAIEVLAHACMDADGGSELFYGIPWDFHREGVAGEALIAVGRAAVPVAAGLGLPTDLDELHAWIERDA